MKKIKRFLKGLKLSYYSFMMSMCVENSEAARVDYGEESSENFKWVQSYDYYSRKYNKTLMGTK